MNALQTNTYTEGWNRFGRETPKAVLAISAHWYVPGIGVTVSTSPRTIHDFGGFEAGAWQMMLAGEYGPLLAYEKLGRDAALSVPTPDHYLPLLYVLGTRQAGESTTFPVEGVDGGSISMLAVRIGDSTPTAAGLPPPKE